MPSTSYGGSFPNYMSSTASASGADGEATADSMPAIMTDFKYGAPGHAPQKTWTSITYGKGGTNSYYIRTARQSYTRIDPYIDAGDLISDYHPAWDTSMLPARTVPISAGGIMFADANTFRPILSSLSEWATADGSSPTQMDNSGFSTTEPWYWYEIPSISNNNWKASAFGGTEGRFVAISPDGADRGMTWPTDSYNGPNNSTHLPSASIVYSAPISTL